MDENDNRERRLALMQYDVLGNGPEEEFEQIIVLTQMMFATPMAAITLLDGKRQWIKSQRGFPSQSGTPDIVFSAHTLAETGAFRVEDARHDQRFAHHPTVVGPPGFRSYIGAALRTPDGTRIGTICVIDTVPRDFSDIDGEIMEQLARLTVANLELHLIASKDATTGAEARRAFMDTVGRELERHRRRGTRSALMICRVEGLKDVSTIEGPDAANVKMGELAERIRGGMRKTDILGRVGYGSFAILLADAGQDEADAAAERLRAAVKDSQTDTVTVRFGYVPAAVTFASGADWMAAADRVARSGDKPTQETGAQDATHLGIGPRWMN